MSKHQSSEKKKVKFLLVLLHEEQAAISSLMVRVKNSSIMTIEMPSMRDSAPPRSDMSVDTLRWKTMHHVRYIYQTKYGSINFASTGVARWAILWPICYVTFL